MQHQTTIAWLLLVTSHFLLHECQGHLRGSDENYYSSAHNKQDRIKKGNYRELQLVPIVAEWPNNGGGITTVEVVNSLCGQVYDWFFDTAVSEWSLSEALRFKKISGNCSSQDYIPGKINVVNRRYPNVGWSGLASYQYNLVNNKWRIDSVLVTMNDHYLQNNAMSTSTYYHRRQNMCHELGHAIGIGHPDLNHNNMNKGSCMDYSAYPQGGWHNGVNYGPSNLIQSQKDYNALKNAYFNPTNRKLTNYTSAESANVTEASIRPYPQNVGYETSEKSHIFETYDLGAEKLNIEDIGMLVSEKLQNGMMEQTYEKLDEESGTLIVTVTSGVDEAHRI